MSGEEYSRYRHGQEAIDGGDYRISTRCDFTSVKPTLKYDVCVRSYANGQGKVDHRDQNRRKDSGQLWNVSRLHVSSDIIYLAHPTMQQTRVARLFPAFLILSVDYQQEASVYSC